MSAIHHLQKQLKEITKSPIGGFRIEVGDDLFNWTVWFSGPKDTHYYGGEYKAQLKFTDEFPFRPPEMRVLSTFWHPNVYPDGKVCISILHQPGTDQFDPDETADMRWSPIQTIDKILVSVISLLADPDASGAGAPANVEALVEFRKHKEKYAQRCQENAKKSLAELPADWVKPPETDAPPVLPMTPQDSQVLVDEHYADEEEPYACELRQIRDMGMGSHMDDDALRALITKCKGDVMAVLERL
jgi:ubiquitin-conjugating enzyme E2 R